MNFSSSKKNSIKKEEEKRRIFSSRQKSFHNDGDLDFTSCSRTSCDKRSKTTQRVISNSYQRDRKYSRRFHSNAFLICDVKNRMHFELHINF